MGTIFTLFPGLLGESIYLVTYHIKNPMQNGQNSVAGSEATNGGVSGTIGKLAENVQINVS